MTILFQKTMPLSIPNYRSLTPPMEFSEDVKYWGRVHIVERLRNVGIPT